MDGDRSRDRWGACFAHSCPKVVRAMPAEGSTWCKKLAIGAMRYVWQGEVPFKALLLSD